MGVESLNLIEVTGPRADVLKFRRDGRRKVPAVVEFSIEELFRKHRLPAPSEAGIPCHFGIYFASVGRTRKLEEFARLDYSLVFTNYEIYEFLIPLSRVFPALCFVNSEACQGDITSTFVTRGRASRCTLPENSDEYLKRAAETYGIPDLEKAYLDPECNEDLLFVENEADAAMAEAALRHWDKRVLSTLRRRSPA